jgi:predicted DsbA family dithiol-disulfide isomerase
MRIDVVSDVVCPWCFIGKRQLESALAAWAAEHPGQAQPEVVWHPFQLNPAMPPEGASRAEYLTAKFGTADTSRLYANVRAAAAEVALPLALDRIARQPSTLRPHALLAAALEAGGPALQSRMAEVLFAAYFQEGANLCDAAELTRLGLAAGLTEAQVSLAMSDPALADEVARVDAGMRDAGIGGVPFFVVNGRVAVNGAQGAEAIGRALRRAETLEPAPFALAG